MKGRDWMTWAGLALVGAAAAVLSFSALQDLAERCGITSVVLGVRLSWLLPVTVDVFAAVTTRVWLRRAAPPEAVRFARWSAWSAIGASLVGNAWHGFLAAEVSSPPWWSVVLLAAVPAAALGALVHLAVVLGRRDADQSDQGAAPPPDLAWWALLDQVGAEPWERALASWSVSVGKPARPAPDRDSADEVLAADLRLEDADQGRPLARDAVLARYGIGATRAARIRQLADRSADLSVVRPASDGAAS